MPPTVEMKPAADLGPKEVAGAMGVSETTAKRLLCAGKLRGYKVGKLWRTRENWIEQFRQENTVRAGRGKHA
jgi:excisionase family DNA binding protein